MKRILVMLCAVAVCFSVTAQTDYVETWDPDADGDGLIGVSDLLALLGVFQEEDMDNDGIWDSQDDCVGAYDECGVCNGPGPQILGIDTIIVYYDSLYAEAIDEWWVFAVGADTLLTYLCENPGCMDPTADNYDPYAITNDGSCVFSNGNPVCDFLTATYFDGYIYDLVAIGDQCWFAENLRTEHYANGDAITTNLYSEWNSTTNGAMTVYGDDLGCSHDSPDGNACDPDWSLNEYGRLYNWYAVVDERGLCPNGWHVPMDEEWTVLTNSLGGMSVAGEKMQSTYGWYGGDNGSNSSGFSGLPGGYRMNAESMWAGTEGGWWSSSPNSENSSWIRNIFFNNVFRSSWAKAAGVSVRCVRD